MINYIINDKIKEQIIWCNIFIINNKYGIDKYLEYVLYTLIFIIDIDLIITLAGGHIIDNIFNPCT